MENILNLIKGYEKKEEEMKIEIYNLKMRERILKKIEDEVENEKEGKNEEIWMKMK